MYEFKDPKTYMTPEQLAKTKELLRELSTPKEVLATLVITVTNSGELLAAGATKFFTSETMEELSRVARNAMAQSIVRAGDNPCQCAKCIAARSTTALGGPKAMA